MRINRKIRIKAAKNIMHKKTIDYYSKNILGSKAFNSFYNELIYWQEEIWNLS
jgi:hypothetical protein